MFVCVAATWKADKVLAERQHNLAPTGARETVKASRVGRTLVGVKGSSARLIRLGAPKVKASESPRA